jgi:hypothetical protein
MIQKICVIIPIVIGFKFIKENEINFYLLKIIFYIIQNYEV